jgi:O-succinylbenzoic acid--CoA ligase
MKIFFRPEAPPEELFPSVREKAAKLAGAFAQGKRFFVLSEPDPRRAVEWIWASFLSPVALVPLHPSLPEEAKSAALSQLPNSWVTEEGLTYPPQRPREKKPEEIWAVIFSSGSTGAPKGVALSGRALRAGAEAHALHNGNSRWLLNLPVYHVGGLSVVSRAFFLNGEIAVASPRFSAEETAAWVKEGGVEGLSLVPTTLARFLPLAPAGHRLKTILLGGAPSGPELVAEALGRGLPVRLTYGMTENCSQIATEKEAGGGLKPLPGVRARISAENEIEIRSEFLASGYFQTGELRELPRQEGFFPTGDLGRINNGNLVVEGRKSEMIISGGIKIFPAEIERHLPIPGLDDAAVTSVPDSVWGERVCLAMVGSIAPDTVKTLLASKIDPRKMPRSWVFLPQIPRSATGKPLRAELRRLVAEKLKDFA